MWLFIFLKKHQQSLHHIQSFYCLCMWFGLNSLELSRPQCVCRRNPVGTKREFLDVLYIFVYFSTWQISESTASLLKDHPFLHLGYSIFHIKMDYCHGLKLCLWLTNKEWALIDWFCLCLLWCNKSVLLRVNFCIYLLRFTLGL